MKLKIEFYRSDDSIFEAVMLLIASKTENIRIKDIKNKLIAEYPEVPNADLYSFGKNEFNECSDDSDSRKEYNEAQEKALKICNKLFKRDFSEYLIDNYK